VAAILEGFGVIAVVVAVGYLLARSGAVGGQAQRALSQVVFFVGAPALLFLTLADAEVDEVLSSGLVVTAVTSSAMALGYAVLARWVWERPATTVVVGALASSYVNAGNLGIPITVYVLGSAAYVAPVMLFQLVVIAPVAFAVLDAAALGHRPPLLRIASRPLTNPVTVGSALGLAAAAASWEPPMLVAEPLALLGGLAVPAALLAFGISLHGAPRPGSAGSGRDLALVVALKTAVQPVLALLLGRALGLEGTGLLAVTLCAALPTAQNVFVYAVRYDRSVPLARDAIALTTLVSVPVLVLIAALLAPR
jgi:malonate transporter and related proteins